ncbi:MAG: TonB-dependent receptor domain-containing protein [Leptolyngbyaceae cyanobacterium]
MSNVWMRVGAVAPLVTLLLMAAGTAARASLVLSQGDSLLAQAEPTAITDIQLRSADGTIELWLETSGDLATPTTSVSGNTLTVDIDAVLALPTADIFSVTDPAADITNITVTQVTNNHVRIDITGQEAAPSITPRPNATGLALTITPESGSVANITGEGFEVGIKAELGDLLATLAYFDITRQNVATPDPLEPFSSVATGKQRSQGVELDVVGEIMPGWNIIASYAYTDARVTEDNIIPDGNGLFNAPEHSASLWTTYEIQTGDLQGLGFGAGFNFVGERDGDLDNSFVLDDYFLTNAGVVYRRDNWRFALNAKNLFDVDYIAASNNSRTSGLEPGAPFTIVGSVSVTF